MIKYEIIKENICITTMKQDQKHARTAAIAPLPDEYTVPLEFDQAVGFTAEDSPYKKNKEFTPLPEEHLIPPEFGEAKKSAKMDTVDEEQLSKTRKKMIRLAIAFIAVLYTPLMNPEQGSAANPEDIFSLIQQEVSVEASVAIDAEETLPEKDDSVSSTTDVEEVMWESNAAVSDSTYTEQTTSANQELAAAIGTEQTTSTNTEQEVSTDIEQTTSSNTEQSISTDNTSVTTEPTEDASSVETPVNDCSVCGGTGKCDECKGDGYLGPGHTVSCPRCHGSGVETCPYCDGAGNSLRHEGACDFAPCMGSHIYPCTTCNGGTTAVTCNSCGGTGKCQTCSQ